MAGKLGSQCHAPRCPNIVVDGRRYCPEHRKENWGGSANKDGLTFYKSAQWQRVRRLKLGKDPICQVCAKRLATQVHHVKKARDFPELRFVMSNLQSICLWCHAKETQKETRETINGNKKRVDD